MPTKNMVCPDCNKEKVLEPCIYCEKHQMFCKDCLHNHHNETCDECDKPITKSEWVDYFNQECTPYIKRRFIFFKQKRMDCGDLLCMNCKNKKEEDDKVKIKK